MRSAPLLVLLAFAPSTDAIAQELTLQPGQRVRVTVPSRDLHKHEDTFREIRGDILVLESMWSPLPEVTRLDVYRGRKSAAGTGALIGAAVGFTLGAIGGAAMCSDPFFDCEPVAGAVLMGTLTGALASGLGALVGLAIQSDRWDEVPLDRVRVSVVPLRDGRFAFAMSVSF